MTTTIHYTLPSGRKAVITVAPHSFRGKITATTTATVDGAGSMSPGRITPAGLPTWAVSSIGKLPLTPEIDAAVAAAEAAINDAHAASNAAMDAHIAEMDAVSAVSEMIARRMAC